MASIVVTPIDAGKCYEVEPGDLLEVRLPENAGTGYRWSVEEANEDVVVVTSTNVKPPSGSAAIGGSGTRTFSFEAKRQGTARVRIKHWREWEGDRSVTDRLEFTVRVGERPSQN